MGGIGLLILIVLMIAVIQAFLSLKGNKFSGLMIPGVNLLCSVIISLLFTDMFSAILGFALTAVPILIWLGIYSYCRRKLEKKKSDDIKRMKINDL